MQQAWAASRGTATYFKEIRRLPMLKAEQTHMLVALWREAGDRRAAHQLLTSHLRLGRQDCEGLPRIRPAHPRFDLGGQRRPHSGPVPVRFAESCSIFDLCRLVDQGGHPSLHPTHMVGREDGNHRQSEKAVFQAVQGQGTIAGASGRRLAARRSYRGDQKDHHQETLISLAGQRRPLPQISGRGRKQSSHPPTGLGCIYIGRHTRSTVTRPLVSLCSPISRAAPISRVSAPGSAARVSRQPSRTRRVFVVNSHRGPNRVRSCDTASEFHQIWMRYYTVIYVD
jgi:hypothetical protein